MVFGGLYCNDQRRGKGVLLLITATSSSSTHFHSCFAVAYCFHEGPMDGGNGLTGERRRFCELRFDPKLLNRIKPKLFGVR